VLDRWRTKRRVPRVRAGEIRAERQVRERIRVIVEHGADFVHVGNAIVVFGTEGEPREGVEFGDADRVKVPSTEDRKKRE